MSKNTLSSSIPQLTTEVLQRLGIIRPSNQQITLVRAMLDYLANEREIQFDARLSHREKTCLYFIAKGKSLEEIAGLMNIKRTTVATFIKRIKTKLACDTLAQAVFEGMGYKESLGDFKQAS
ncbi:MAG: helix-turn-helix transcriptional regulator [Gammaproteobacteria bacterium]